MRFDQLEYFYALASCQTIQAVSEKFYTSPQVVSKAIKQLEEELGTLLFIRTKKGLLLTEAGTDVYPYIAEILKNYQYLNDKYINKKTIELQNLKILSCKGTLFYFSKLIQDMNLTTPEPLNFIIKVATVQEVQQILYAKNDYDVIATVLGDSVIETIRKDPFIKKNYELNIIQRDPLKIWMSKNSPWAGKEKLSYKQLKNFSFVRYNLEEISFDQYLKDKFHIKLHYPYQVSEISLALEFVLKNQCCFFAPEYFIMNTLLAAQRQNIISVDLDIEFFQNVVFLINKNKLKDPYFSAIIEKLRH